MCKLKLEVNQCYNLDCKVGMQLMKEQGIKADWCITDPPYGIGVGTMTYTNGVAIAGKAAATRRDYTCKDNLWDNERIGKEFFDLIFEYGTSVATINYGTVLAIVNLRGAVKVWREYSTICLTECYKAIWRIRTTAFIPRKNRPSFGLCCSTTIPKKAT